MTCTSAALAAAVENYYCDGPDGGGRGCCRCGATPPECPHGCHPHCTALGGPGGEGGEGEGVPMGWLVNAGTLVTQPIPSCHILPFHLLPPCPQRPRQDPRQHPQVTLIIMELAEDSLSGCTDNPYKRHIMDLLQSCYVRPTPAPAVHTKGTSTSLLICVQAFISCFISLFFCCDRGRGWSWSQQFCYWQ